MNVAHEQAAARLHPAFTIAAATDADASEWDAFVGSHPGATGYHVWAWRRVFDRAFGHESIYLSASREGRVVGVLPLVQVNSMLFGRTLTSLPFLNYGGIVADSDAVARALVDHAAGLARARRCRHVELRHKNRRFPDLACKQHKVTMLLSLESGMWERLDRKVRNQIRKAQKSDLTADHGGSELLRDFYAVFARNMRDLGTPVYARRFFEQVLQAFSDRTRLHVVRLQGKPIAAALTYRTGDTIEAPWASSVRDYNSLCPNHMLYWDLIELALREGCRVFDFGRSTPDEGTYKFKEQWGAKPLPLHWEYQLIAGTEVPNASPTNPKYRLAVELWKKLPLAIATQVGPRIVRGIP